MSETVSEYDTVEIARCPVHGLHGEREECFACGATVEKVRMVPEAAVGRAQRSL